MPTRIKPVSRKLAKARRLYIKLRRAYLAQNPECVVFRNKPASQIHHRRGRIGTLLIDQRFWIAVSMEGHEWIHHNPELARADGFTCHFGQWNTAPRDAETERLKKLLR